MTDTETHQSNPGLTFGAVYVIRSETPPPGEWRPPNTNENGGVFGSPASLRDYFAAKAMAAILSTYREWREAKEPIEPGTWKRDGTSTFFADLAYDSGDGAEEIAGFAYLFADAMLKAREAP